MDCQWHVLPQEGGMLFILLTLLSGVSADDSPASVQQKTVIAIEVLPSFFTDVFILGGFTNGNESRCVGDVSSSPCSIPVHHILPANAPESYEKWAVGDHYLDLVGAEPEQGFYDGKEPYGTPLRSLDQSTAAKLLNTGNSGHGNSQYWAVEVEMDCSNTSGYFEVEAVVRTRTNKMMYETLSRQFGRMSGMDPSKIKIKPPRATVTPLDPDNRGEGHFHAKGRFQGEGIRHDHSHKWEKPGGLREREVELKQDLIRNSFAQGCYGTVHMDVPFESERHIGLCGKVNIFRYKSSYCEINEL